MKKSLTAAQLKQVTDMIERAKTFVGEPLQLIDFTPTEVDIDINPDLDLGLDSNLDLKALPPLSARSSPPAAARAPCPGTKKMSIRMPNAVTQIFKDEAKRRGTQYQTLMIRVLKEASREW